MDCDLLTHPTSGVSAGATVVLSSTSPELFISSSFSSNSAGAMTRIVSLGVEDDVCVGIDVHALRPLVHDDVDLLVGLELAHGRAGELARGADHQVGQVDVLAGELESLVDLVAQWPRR